MVRIKIDSKEVEVKTGTRVIDALRSEGVEVPAMCYIVGTDHFTSCMVCMVKDARTGKLYPSCSYKVEDGMEIISGDEEVIKSRKMALELLLSEHVGDCEAPCQVTCPAHMDIPEMNRMLAEGRFGEALRVVKKDIALPAVFGRICPAPCEGACRRKSIDEPVSICLLKRYAGDHDLDGESHYIPEISSDKKKNIAIIGSGPAGLAAAYYLQIRGYQCMVFDRNERPGGSLRKEVDEIMLPPSVLDEEINILKSIRIQFEQGKTVERDLFQNIISEYDALIIATGKDLSELKNWGLSLNIKGIDANPDTYRVGDTKIFAVGSVLKPTKLAIRVLGQGKEVAFSVDQFLQGMRITGEPFMFNSRFGKLLEEELDEYLKESVPYERLEPAGHKQGQPLISPSEIQKGIIKEDRLEESPGYNREEVMKEAARCLHCDCRDLKTCKLRIYSDHYHANQRHFSSETRKKVSKKMQHDAVIYEPSKCIKCGICVRLTSEHKEDFGLTFIGRGFDVEVGIPFDEPLKVGLKKVAIMVAEACPTGAISRKS